jgi:intermediate peptidase
MYLVRFKYPRCVPLAGLGCNSRQQGDWRSSVRSFVHLSTLAPTSRCCLGQNERTRGLGHLRATVAFLHTTSSAAKEDSKSVQGLFGIKGLVSPEDFRRLAAEAEAEVESLLTVAIRGEASGAVRGQAFVGILDQISDTICLVMDAAELCRSTHPQAQWKRAAMQAYDHLAHLVARLNMHSDLYDALERITKRASGGWPSAQASTSKSTSTQDFLDDEQLRVAHLLLLDFQRGGVHLDAAGRARVLALQDEIGRLSFEYVDGTSPSPSAPPPPLPSICIPVSLARQLPHDLQKQIVWVGREEVAEVAVTREVYLSVLQHVPVEAVRKAVYMAEHAYSHKVDGCGCRV